MAPLQGVPGAAALAGATTVTEDASLVLPSEAECSICLDSFEEPVCTPCTHWCVWGVSRLSQRAAGGLLNDPPAALSGMQPS